MSAFVIKPAWQVCRALSALVYGLDIEIEAYALVFELDVDETMEVFDDAAASLGMSMVKLEKPVFH